MSIIRMYELNSDQQYKRIFLPRDTEILSVCVRHEQILICAKHDEYIEYEEIQAHLEDYTRWDFRVVKSDRSFEMNKYGSYIFLGTVVLNYGNDIYHVFYKKNEK